MVGSSPSTCQPCQTRPAWLQAYCWTTHHQENIRFLWFLRSLSSKMLIYRITTGQDAGPKDCKPQHAHLRWLHNDICGWLCNAHGLHLPPLIFNCLSCTRNMADICWKKQLRGFHHHYNKVSSPGIYNTGTFILVHEFSFSVTLSEQRLWSRTINKNHFCQNDQVQGFDAELTQEWMFFLFS